MATKFCICGNPAVMRATVTTIDGEVLDTEIYCGPCAEWHRDAFMRAGLVLGKLPEPVRVGGTIHPTKGDTTP